MIDAKKWNRHYYEGEALSTTELYDTATQTFECPRCGRADLPLILFPEHNKSCAFECGIGGHAIDVVSDLHAEIEGLYERIRKLEMAVRDGLTTINWYGGWTVARGIDHDCRGVARMVMSMRKALGPEGSYAWEEFRCDRCKGLFAAEHMHEDPEIMDIHCEWCKR